MKKNNQMETNFVDPTPFTVKSYWLDFQAHPKHSSIAPTIVLSSTKKRTDTPAAIVYFHYSADFTEKSNADANNPNLFYLHYHVSMLEVILELLKSGKSVECYVNKGGSEVWGGIRLKKEISV